MQIILKAEIVYTAAQVKSWCCIRASSYIRAGKEGPSITMSKASTPAYTTPPKVPISYCPFCGEGIYVVKGEVT